MEDRFNDLEEYAVEIFSGNLKNAASIKSLQQQMHALPRILSRLQALETSVAGLHVTSVASLHEASSNVYIHIYLYIYMFYM